MKVVYGHTDSIYVTVPSVNEAKELCEHLNAHVQSLFPNLLGFDEHPVQLEFEKYYQSLGVGVKKNRNAGLVSWEDGVYLDKPKFTMTGFMAKRVSETKLAKEHQTKVLKMWASENTKGEINDFCRKRYNEIKDGNISLKELVDWKRVRENRLTVKCVDCKSQYSIQNIIDMPNCECGTSKTFFTTLDKKSPSIGSHISGALWYHSNFNEMPDSVHFIKIKPGNLSWIHPITGLSRKLEWLAAPTYNKLMELIDRFKVSINYLHYADVIVKKSQPVFDAMEWEINPVRLDIRQKTLDEWF